MDNEMTIEKITEMEDEFSSDDYMEDFVIKLSTNVVSNLSLDVDEFKKGIASVSALCGKIAALSNVGVTPSMALSYLADVETRNDVLANNKEIAKINNDGEAQAFKAGMLNMQKNSL